MNNTVSTCLELIILISFLVGAMALLAVILFYAFSLLR